MSVSIFESERLLFRRLELADLDNLYALYSDRDIRRYFPDGTLSHADTRDELEWFANGGNPAHPDLGLWATIHKPSGCFIGRCGLIPWTIDQRLEIEIAYLLDKRIWRQGFGAEAARGLVRHGFASLGLQRLIALIDPENVASQRTAMKAGLNFERSIELEGARCDMYAIARPINTSSE